jgi:CBS domain-containing protein
MFRSSFPIGKLFGVDLRVHASLPALLALALIYSNAMSGSITRGLGLCFALLLAIVIREAARALAAAYNGLHLRALLVFPVGGVMAFASADGDLEPATRLITLITPIANILAGLLILGLAYGVDPRVQLFAQPWISPTHILRSVVWTQFALGAVSMLPIATLTSRRLPLPRKRATDENTSKDASPQQAAPTINISLIIALALLTAGFIVMNLWMLLLGGLMLITSMVRIGIPLDASGAGSLLVRDAMQFNYATLSSSDTLMSALERSRTSSQDVFPVTRGDRLVGSISRDTLTSQIISEGDGYVQGAMNRSLILAFANEPVATALRRSASLGAGDLIAVVDDDSVVGILTHQGVMLAVQRSAALRPLRARVEEPDL